MNDDIDKYLGCILGLSIGDALGAPVEFSKLRDIQSKFGKAGVTDLVSWIHPAGYYTDDTQMSLATIDALLKVGQAIRKREQYSPTKLVYQNYLKWLRMQQDPKYRRAPGTTCLSALQSGRMGTIEKPLNNSKGCGGVMRTAPVGLAFETGELAFRYGAEFAAITHGHPSGYLSAGFLAELIFHLVRNVSIEESILRSRKTLVTYRDHEETLAIVDRACDLAQGDISTLQGIRNLGEGWTGEEALAISLFCSLRFQDDWKAGVLAAVNHSGDSDSTGSITGAILGTLLGKDAIPEDWVQKLENSRIIELNAVYMYKTFSPYFLYQVGHGVGNEKP